MKRALASLRAESGKTLAALEAELNIPLSTLSLYESGKRTPRLERARRIAQYFAVPLDDVVFGPHVCESQSIDEMQSGKGA